MLKRVRQQIEAQDKTTEGSILVAAFAHEEFWELRTFFDRFCSRILCSHSRHQGSRRSRNGRKRKPIPKTPQRRRECCTSVLVAMVIIDHVVTVYPEP